jgi:hypothetical protein
VLLKSEDSTRGRYLSILNTSSQFCARKLKYYKIEKNKIYPPGKYVYFSGKIEVSP